LDNQVSRWKEFCQGGQNPQNKLRRDLFRRDGRGPRLLANMQESILAK